MLYNLAQNPISDRLREYLLAQVSETPPQETLDKIGTKIGKEWFDKLNFHRTARVDDVHGGRPRFFVYWSFSAFDTTNCRPHITFSRTEIELRDDLKTEVKPPDKLAVLHGYSSEGYLKPTVWFYCLPEEVESLKKKALDDAMRPFEDVREIDFTKEEPPSDILSILHQEIEITPNPPDDAPPHSTFENSSTTPTA